ncbi:hypothetical protein BTVI_87638 [Pitangus sulphuratus]|nr:hypothetical protein BTVI_87638 [Pitangus sulphuratus]
MLCLRPPLVTGEQRSKAKTMSYAAWMLGGLEGYILDLLLYNSFLTTWDDGKENISINFEIVPEELLRPALRHKEFSRTCGKGMLFWIISLEKGVNAFNSVEWSIVV